MTEIYQQLASYNLWADQRLTALIISLTTEQQQLELPSSFPSLFKTLTHMYFANVVWWKRVKEEGDIPPVNSSFNGGLQALAASLVEQDRLWESWLQQAAPGELELAFTYTNTRGEQFSQPVSQAVMQVFNHATYHRGQLVTMLHQLGVKQIPATDFIVWSRRSL